MQARAHRRILAHGPPARRRLGGFHRDAALDRIVTASQLAARFHAGHQLQPGTIDVFFDATSETHAARRLSLCMGRRAVRVPAARGLGQLGSRAAPAQYRARLGHLPAHSEDLGHRRSGRRIERRRLLPHQPLRLSEGARAGALSASAIAQRLGRFHAAEQSEPAGRHQLRLLVASGVAVALLVAPGEQDFRLPGFLFALRSAFQHRLSRSRTLSQQMSRYRDNSHTATALLDFTWPHSKRFTPKLAAGGSFFISSGSRPTSYYQPDAKLWVPLSKNLSWFSEWRYYGYGEAFYLYEGFRTHLVTTGVRFTR